MDDVSLKEYIVTRLDEVNLSEEDLHNLYLELKKNMLKMGKNRVVQNERL
ncbi:hypothetical protein [Oceanirhabdus sp. W0125-5]|nr:hypothetical protein [Oceanirhabdus sp. W0125-5]WBW96055.1 hypothetical protein OW730_20525 [Oceanirhabdus sp. W0125-5]